MVKQKCVKLKWHEKAYKKNAFLHIGTSLINNFTETRERKTLKPTLTMHNKIILSNLL